jgi:hypothetical protein
MNIYRQLTQYDSLLACIATTLQAPIEDLFPSEFRAYIEQVKGCYGREVNQAFNFAALNPGTDYHCVHIPSGMANSRTVIQLLQGRRAIIQVPSLNIVGSVHHVFWAGEVLYDLSRLQNYSTLDQLVMQFVWVFEERPMWRKPALAHPNELAPSAASYAAEAALRAQMGPSTS